MPENNKITGFKAFYNDWKCKNFQFKVGETYIHEGSVEICKSGFHFCENPLDIFSYYPPTSKFAEVEGETDIKNHTDDSKIACKKLFIKKEIDLNSLINFGVKFILEKINWKDIAATNTGDGSAATNTGYRSAATNTGYGSAATNTGDGSAAIVEGKNSIAFVMGKNSKAKGALNCWLVLTEWENDDIKQVKSVKVDGKKIKPDTFYTFKNGKIVKTN